MSWKNSDWPKSSTQVPHIELPFFFIFLRLLSNAGRRSGSQGLASAGCVSRISHWRTVFKNNFTDEVSF